MATTYHLHQETIIPECIKCGVAPPTTTTSYVNVPEFEWSPMATKKLKGLKKRGEEQDAVKGTPAWHRGVGLYKRGVDKIGTALYNWICKRRVPDAVKRRAEHLVAVADGSVESVDTYTEANEEPPKNTVPGDAVKRANKKPRRTNGDWWVEFALEVRTEHPYPSDTIEMRRTMHRFAVDLMKSRKVRMVDIARVVPLVVEMAYVPVEAEVLTRQLRESPAVRHRIWDSCATYWSWWFGVQPRQTAGG